MISGANAAPDRPCSLASTQRIPLPKLLEMWVKTMGVVGRLVSRIVTPWRPPRTDGLGKVVQCTQLCRQTEDTRTLARALSRDHRERSGSTAGVRKRCPGTIVRLETIRGQSGRCAGGSVSDAGRCEGAVNAAGFARCGLGRGSESVAGNVVERRKHVEDYRLVELRDAMVVGIPHFRVQPEPQFADVDPPDIQSIVDAICA